MNDNPAFNSLLLLGFVPLYGSRKFDFSYLQRPNHTMFSKCGGFRLFIGLTGELHIDVALFKNNERILFCPLSEDALEKINKLTT